MTELTPSAITGQAAQTKAAAVKNPSITTGLTNGGRITNGMAAQGLYDPRNEHDACGVGFIVNMKNVKSHQIVKDGLFVLENLTHRGAVGADPLMGDGAGVLVQIPDRFFREEMAAQGVELPAAGQYGVGHWFMPQDAALRAHVEDIIAESAQSEGLPLLGFRDVPVDNSSLSKAPDIAASEPFHRQVFIGRTADIPDDEEYEARLYLLRKVISGRIYAENNNRDIGAYCVSLSARTIVYKGMFLAYQVGAYYRDLSDPRFETALILVHQRFSTNTFPSWKLAHPYRMVAHNGEINTVRGNNNWMAARQASVDSELFGNNISKLWPISYDGQSDTACFDNALEFLFQGGYSLSHAMMMLIPEAWAGNKLMDADRKLIELAKPALEAKQPVKIEVDIRNVDRSTGAMLSGEVAKRFRHKGLREDTIQVKLTGTAGQSFGAFLARGISFELVGAANDYVGKGLSGGRIVIRPPEESKIVAAESIIVGNTVLYGATEGEAYFAGVAGERFAVRNSGVAAVVEGVGDHGCEYMTGGIVVVIGQTGRNFAAGMSGGVAYVLDEAGDFAARCNMAMVELEPVPEEDDLMERLLHHGGDLDHKGRVDVSGDMTSHDEERLYQLISNHVHFTGSVRGREILDDWTTFRPKFRKIMPVEYRRALIEMERMRMGVAAE
jgi:glutamate synthase domain-containing protein 1/glutamate synthase domain-containing protein 3